MVNSKLIRLSHGGITQNCYAKPKSKPYFAEVDLKKGNNNLYEISAYRAIMQFIKLPLVTVQVVSHNVTKDAGHGQIVKIQTFSVQSLSYSK